MAEDIRLAKGEDLDSLSEKVDALTETADAHINNAEIHITQADMDRWDAKADLSLLENEGYMKKRMVSVLPSLSAEFNFTDDVSKFSAANRCTAAIENNENDGGYQKITTDSDAANVYAFAFLDFSEFTKDAKEIVIEFDTKINGDRWYIGLSDLSQRPGSSNQDVYDRSGVVFSQGTKDGAYYYVNDNLIWKDSFFNAWVHSSITIDFEEKSVEYLISNGNTSATLSGMVAFFDERAEQVTGIEVYSYMNDVELCIDNISITANFGGKSDERTVYVVPEDGAFAEYIYVDGKPVCTGRSDIVKTVNDLLERVIALENT